MDWQSNEALQFNKSRHEIRRMQIIADDLASLQKHRKIKVPGTTLNAVGALIQLLAERDGNTDFAVFSSWLSPLISKQVDQNSHYGTIRGHIEDACQGAPMEILLAKSRWLFPMYGSTPPHWVLGWIEPNSREYHIFDSVPELRSFAWAEPALLELGDTIYTTLGHPKVDWNPWRRVLDSPPELGRQMNPWACGIFVIHAMTVVSKGEGTETVTNSETERVRAETLELIMANTTLFQPPALPLPTEDIVMAAATIEEQPMVIVENPPIVNEATTMDVEAPLQNSLDDETIIASSPKRKIEAVGEDSVSRPVKAPKHYSKPADREKSLKANSRITAVEAHRVKCKGCTTWILLDKNGKFKAENWDRHASKCSGIIGTKIVRTAVVKKPTKIAKGAASITAFFGKGKSKAIPEAEPSSDSGSDSEKKTKRTVTYNVRTVNATQSIATIFDLGPIKSHPSEPIREPERCSCRHLSGAQYEEYIERTETRTMGGVSPALRARITRQIFMYKKLGEIKSVTGTTRAQVEMAIPTDGNGCISAKDWTDVEHVRLYEALKGYARWEVNYGKKTVRSTRCERLTPNDDGVCDACTKLESDASFTHAVNRKKKESELPLNDQHTVLMAREKYSGQRFHDDEARNLADQLKDPLVFKAFKLLQKGESTECFVYLYEACLNGKLKNYETFKQLCGVLMDVLQREGTDKKYGIRFPADYLNFMILLRSYGGQSSRQYGILAGQLPCPSSRQLRALVSKSEDALQNPYLIYENMARVRRLVDSLKYTGPVAVAGDCTKVRKRLTYSPEFGGHILGGVLPFDECVAESPEEIDTVIAKITKAKAEATQVRAILVKVLLPHIPPQVVALIPTDGKDDAAKIIEGNLKLLKMAAELNLPVVIFSADGAASELSAQNMFDKQITDFPPLTFSYPLYGINLRTPVFETGPAVAGQDAGHGSKTGRNQPQHGTHTASMGKGKVVNNDLVRLQRTGKAGLLKSDVTDVDKQDDGPARRMWHHAALLACTTEEEGVMKIVPGFEGLFVYMFVFGVLFDAWMNRTMTVANRVSAVLRARFWLHYWRAHIVNMSAKYPDLYSTTRSFISPASFHIFNRLCDSLLLLVIIYARYYPDQPFCPWLLGTEFVEHFFGLARMMLPNFTYAEFLKMAQHMMVRQRILLSGTFKEKRDRNANVGYVLDFDASPLTPEDRKVAQVTLTDDDFKRLVEVACNEASLICTQLMGIPAPLPTELKPLVLVPLGAPMRKGKQAAKQDDSDSESEFDPEEEDAGESDEEDVPEPPAGAQAESRTLALAAHDTARYSALCEDFENAVKEVQSDPVVFGPAPPPVSSINTSVVPSAPADTSSEIIEDGKLSIALMVKARLHWQGGTTTRSQKTFKIDSKYALARISRGIGMQGDDDTEPEKMTHQEAAQRARVAQDSNSDIQDSKPRKARELRWKGIASTLQRLVDTNVIPNISAKNVHALNPLSIGSFTLMWNGKRFYIGQILDVYKKGASSRYGSIEDSTTVSSLSYMSLLVYLPLSTGVAESEADAEDIEEIPAPLFSCQDRQAHLHTHAKAEHLIFHLGRDIFERSEGVHQTLLPHPAQRWNALTRPGKASKEVKKLTLKLKRS